MEATATLADELLLQIFSHLPLVGIIRARGVCKKWRVMVLQADILPMRRSFFDFYLEALECPLFLPSRPWILENLQPFDRKAYVSRLESLFTYIPEQFKFWLLEWPAMATIGPAWPGLSYVCRPDRWWHDTAYNLLHVDHTPSTFLAEVLFRDEETSVPVLLLPLMSRETLVDEEVYMLSIDTYPRAKDRVFWTPVTQGEMALTKENDEGIAEKIGGGFACRDWLCYLREALLEDEPEEH